MARIICFSDSLALVRAVCRSISSRDHTLFPLPGSQLTEDLRRTVRGLAPDIILIELNRALDNPHLFFFLRSDEATRQVPVIAIAPCQELEPYAAALGANDFLCEPQPDMITHALNRYFPHPVPVYAPAHAFPTRQIAALHRPRSLHPADPRPPVMPRMAVA